MKIEKYRDQIDQIAPLVIDGSADLADVSTAEMVLLVVELQDREQWDAAQELWKDIRARVHFAGWEDDLARTLEDEARAAGQGG